MSEPQTTVRKSYSHHLSSLTTTRVNQLQTGADGLFEAVLQLASHQPAVAPPQSNVQPSQSTSDTSSEDEDEISAAGEEESVDQSEPTSNNTATPVVAAPVAPLELNTTAPVVSEEGTESSEQTEDAVLQVTTASEETDAGSEIVSVDSNQELADKPTSENAPVATVKAPEANLEERVRIREKGRKEPVAPVDPKATATQEKLAVTSKDKPVTSDEQVLPNTQLTSNQTPIEAPENTDGSSRRERRGPNEKKWELSPAAPDALRSSSLSNAELLDTEAPVATSVAESASPLQPELVSAVSEASTTVTDVAVQAINSSVSATAAVINAAATLASRAAESVGESSVSSNTSNTISGVRGASNSPLTAAANTLRAVDAKGAEEPEGPSSSAIDRAKLVQRVSRAFQRLSAEGGTVRVRLHPPSLGAVRVEVKVDGNRMTARMTTESETARAALNDQIADLRQRLNDQGFQVDRILVETDRTNTGTGNDPRQQPGTTFDQSGSDRRSSRDVPEDPTSGIWRDRPRAEAERSVVRAAMTSSLDLRA